MLRKRNALMGLEQPYGGEINTIRVIHGGSGVYGWHVDARQHGVPNINAIAEWAVRVLVGTTWLRQGFRRRQGYGGQDAGQAGHWFETDAGPIRPFVIAFARPIGAPSRHGGKTWARSVLRQPPPSEDVPSRPHFRLRRASAAIPPRATSASVAGSGTASNGCATSSNPASPAANSTGPVIVW